MGSRILVGWRGPLGRDVEFEVEVWWLTGQFRSGILVFWRGSRICDFWGVGPSTQRLLKCGIFGFVRADQEF